jgi:DNA-binding HxlR family transcriptional regulator
MGSPRRYDERCGVAHSLDLVGQRWALLVVRELLIGPKRFTDLRASLPKATPDLLSRRLKELEEAGVIRRRRLPPPAGSTVYELTPWGRELEPAVISLARWGSSSPHMRQDAPVGADSIMLGLRSFFDAGRAHDLRGAYRVVLGDAVFTVGVDPGGIQVSRRDDPAVDATLETDPATLAALLDGSETLAEATSAGRVTTTGDAGRLQELLGAIHLPETVSVGESSGA